MNPLTLIAADEIGLASLRDLEFRYNPWMRASRHFIRTYELKWELGEPPQGIGEIAHTMTVPRTYGALDPTIGGYRDQEPIDEAFTSSRFAAAMMATRLAAAMRGNR